MESRKLISFGSSSYVISIPKAWIEQNKLSKGASVYIDEKPNELVLSVHDEGEHVPKEKTIDALNKSLADIETEIVAAYIKNYDIIEIRQFKEEYAVGIKDIFQDLAGLEVMEQTSSKIVVKDLINLKEVSTKTLIRRIDIIIRSMIDDVMTTTNKEAVDSIYQRDSDVNRLVFLIRRILTAALENPRIARMFDTNCSELVVEWEIAQRLEKIGDQCKRIAKGVAEADVSENKRKAIGETFNRIKLMYLTVMKSYYSKDPTPVFQLESTTSRNMFEDIDKLQVLNGVSKCSPKQHAGCMKQATILNNLKNMVVAIRNIAREVLINSV